MLSPSIEADCESGIPIGNLRHRTQGGSANQYGWEISFIAFSLPIIRMLYFSRGIDFSESGKHDCTNDLIDPSIALRASVQSCIRKKLSSNAHDRRETMEGNSMETKS